MIVCHTCGTQNPEGFRFCGTCAAPLAVVAGTREQRKTVTVLFCDVAGSTSLGETVDPEVLRALLARYFERMKHIIESHGGTVEKFIGDAVMAVFGIPVIHEDDALRAVRAATAMRDALPALGIQGRIGVNTGEVVTGTTERLATGDVVNVAARLQQAAAPQEILIGEATYDLVHQVIDATAVEPLVVKGKAQPVSAHRLVSVGASPARRNEARIVGRSAELERLRNAYDQVVRDRSCQLFTIVGNAGVGKSRLVHEFLAAIGSAATVVTGTCLSYGDGITYVPVVDIIREIQQLRPATQLGNDLSSLMVQESFTSPSDQIAWSFRKLLEETAQQQPLIVVFDDIHWAEPKLLDLIEHIAVLSRDAPILLLCMARPELLDKRPAWAGGKLNATHLLLEPLSGDESAQMVSELVGEMSEQQLTRVVEAAEGNPLFMEEMVALLRDSADEDLRVPPTIHALLAARLDQLDPSEREVLERGSVEGRVFHRGAVEALYPEEREVAARLTALVRKDLVRPDKAELPGEDAFRFRHLLIRDAAYDALPKSTRANLHEGFVRWLEEHALDLPEIDEIVGYHLEQAVKYRLQLGQPVDESVAQRARERLARAGRRAHSRGDLGAAVNLLSRADELPLPPDVTIQFDIMLGSFWGAIGHRALGLVQRHVERAQALGDRAVVLCSRMELEMIRNFVEPEGGVAHLADLIEEAAALSESTGDLRVMYVVHQSRMHLANMVSDVDAAMRGISAAADVAMQLGINNRFIPQRASWRIHSSEPNSETLHWFATEAAGYHADVDQNRAEALAMAGRFDEARAYLADELRLLDAMVGESAVGAVLVFAGARIEILAGNYAAAIRYGEQGCAMLLAAGSPSVASTGAGILARAHFYGGNTDNADEWAIRASELTGPEDLATHLLSKEVRSLVNAQRGNAAESERLSDEVIQMAQLTNSPVYLGQAYFDRGVGMALVGDRDKAVDAFRASIEQHEAKEVLPMIELARARLAELGAN